MEGQQVSGKGKGQTLNLEDTTELKGREDDYRKRESPSPPPPLKKRAESESRYEGADQKIAGKRGESTCR